MMQVISLLLENKAGALMRVTGLLSQRGYNIESLTVARTLDPEVSRMTIVVDADADQARRIVANVYKLVNVLLVDDVTSAPAITRDLALIKVEAAPESRSHVLELVNVFRARVVDVAHDSLTIEITGTEDKIDSMLDVLRPMGLMEVVRTGQVAMRRGAKPVVAATKEKAIAVAEDGNVSYSV